MSRDAATWDEILVLSVWWGYVGGEKYLVLSF